VVRRSFRLGLRLGLLVGVIAALVKVMQARRTADQLSGAGWGTSDPGWVPPAPPPSVPRQPVTAPIAVLEEVGDSLPAGVVAPGLVEEHVVPAPSPPTPRPATKAPTKAAPAKAAPVTTAPAKAVSTKAGPAMAGSAKAVSAKAAKTPAKRTKAAVGAWVEPIGATCPPTHPIKAKLASRLFHIPGMFAYDRTRPDRCYADESAATAEGFTRAKR
jgi:hypothetical protein